MKGQAVVAIPVTSTVRSLHPLHAILLAFPLPLFLGALVSDLTYWSTFHIQWANFSSWLITGGLLIGGFALLWALVDLIRWRRLRDTRPAAYCGALLAMWLLGLVNAFIHAKDAWATMPEGLVLSVLGTLLALVAAWIGYSGFRYVEVE